MTSGGATIDVGVDVGNPAAIDKLFSHMEARLAAVGTQVTKIVESTKNIGANFDKGLAGSLKTLAQMDQRMSSLEKIATTAARAPVASALDAKSFGTKVRAASEFSRSLDTALTKADAFQARLNGITVTLAQQGSASPLQLRRIEQWEKEKNTVASLDRQYEKLQARARLTGQDFTGLMTKVELANRKLETSLMNAGRVTFGKEISEVQTALAQLEAGVASVSRASSAGGAGAAGAKGNGLFGKTGISGIFARTMAYGGAAALGFGALSAGKESLQFLVDFEAGLKQLQAISGSTHTQLNEMTAGIIEVGKSSRFSLTDLTEMAKVLAQAGVSSSQMTDILRSVNNLAVASGSTADEAAQLVTSAIGSFQLQGNEAGRIADLMTEALNRTKLNVQQIGQAIQYVGATAYEENIPLEKVLATIGSLAQAGVKSGSTIGTGFRQFLVDLQNPTEKMTEGLAKFGLKQKDIDVTTRGLTGVIKTLSDAGIGSSEAFGMMERRGAAFYLVAKNNLDVADQLQIAFNGQNAAAVANATAMDSVAAQWQRLKNNEGAKFWQDMVVPMERVKALLEWINQHEEDSKPGQKTGMSWGDGIRQGLDLMTGNIYDLQHYEDQQGSLQTALEKTATDAEAMATAISKAGEKVDEKQQKVDALNHELERLYTQEEGIKSTMNGVAAETSSLSGRFEGLAKYLANTSMSFDDLTNAMRRLKQEEMGLLSGEQMNQSIQLKQARIQDAQNAARLRGSLAGVDLAQMGLSADTIRAIRQPGSDRQQYANNAQLILDAAKQLTDSNNPWAETLRKLGATMLDGIDKGVQEKMAETASYSSRFSSTPRGLQLETGLSQQNSALTRMKNQDYGDRQEMGKTIEANLDKIINSINSQLVGVKDTHLVDYFNKVKAAAVEARKATEAAMSKTDAEIKADKAAEKQAKATETAAKSAARQIKLADLDQLGAKFLSQYGGHPGSSVRSAQEQRNLVAAGKTRVPPERDPHVIGVARDFIFPGKTMDDLRRIATAMQAVADRLFGSGVLRAVPESGSGKNQGTAPQVHLQVNNKYAKKKVNFPDNLDEAMGQQSTSIIGALDSAAVSTANKAIGSSIAQLRNITDQTVFDAGVQQTEADIEAWYAALKTQIVDQAAAQGRTEADPEVQARLQEAKDQRDEKLKEVDQLIFDQFMKMIDRQIEDVKTAFAETMRGPNSRVKEYQGILSGFGYASNQGKIPDYVQQNYQRKAGLAQEVADRTEATVAIPAAVREDMKLMNGLLDRLATEDDAGKADQLRGKIKDLGSEMANLRDRQAELRAQLGAGGLVPTSLADGLKQAAEAYSYAENLGQTLSEYANGHMLEGITKLGDGFTTFFTDIISGTKSVKQAFGDFVKSMIQYIEQLIAKWLAMQVMKMIFNLVGGIAGGAPAGSVGGWSVMGGTYTGGPATKGAYAGEHLRGDPGRDSMLRKVAGGEYIVRKHAVDSVGADFMHDLNNRGKGALSPRAIPMPVMPQQTTNVYVVKPDQQPQLGANDVLVIWQDDVLKNGQTKKLIKQVAQGG